MVSYCIIAAFFADVKMFFVYSAQNWNDHLRIAVLLSFLFSGIEIRQQFHPRSLAKTYTDKKISQKGDEKTYHIKSNHFYHFPVDISGTCQQNHAIEVSLLIASDGFF